MILISLGSNISGKWGPPNLTLVRAMEELDNSGLTIIKKSPIIETEPLGTYAGCIYSNAVVEIGSFCPPDALLRRLKWIEHRAGRREARYASVLGNLPRWRPRVLDLDILDWHGIECGPQDGQLKTGYIPLTLPHPGLNTRPFITELIETLEPI